MFHSTRVGLAALLVLSAACQPAPKAETETATVADESAAGAAGLSTEDEAAVRAIDAEWARAASAGDANALAALYAPDATLLPSNEPVVNGEAAVKKYWVDFTKGFPGTSEITSTAVEGRGDLAYLVGTLRQTPTPKAGAKPLPVYEGKYVTVVKKQPDGSWKIVFDIWNENAPPAKQ